jgi:hypothetical protein
MESNKQEESNLLSKNPIAVQAGGSWISKHMGSPMQMNKGAAGYMKEDESSPAEMHDPFTKKNNINHK